MLIRKQSVRKKIDRINFRHGIARRFIFHLFWFTSFITILTTAIQLYTDYSRDVTHIQDRMYEIESSYLESIVTSLWVFNEELLTVQLRGICQLPDIEYAKIEKGGKLILADGNLESEKTISRQYPMFYDYKNEKINLGTLSVVASLEGVFQRLIDRFFVILAIKSIRSFLLSIFLFIIFYILVGKHLNTIANYTKLLGLNQIESPLTLDKKSRSKSKDDELDTLVLSINEMRKNLTDSFRNIEKLNEQLQLDIAERKRTEAQYRALFEQAADAIFISDIQGCFLDVSPSACKMMGYNRDELLERSFETLIPSEDLKNDPIQYVDLKEGKEVFRERKFQRKDNFMLTVEISARRLEDGRIQAFVRDITARKLSEEALRSSESRYRMLVENSPYSIHQVDEKRRLISMNRAGLIMMGVSSESEIQGMAYLDAVGENDKDKVETLLLEAYKGHASEFEFEAANGASFQSSLVPLADESGKISQLMGLTTDITERKREQERFSAVVESSPFSLVLTNREGQILLVNRETEKQFGYERKELIGKQVEILLPKHLLCKHPDHRKAFYANPQSRAMGMGRDLYALYKDGSEFPVEVGLTTIESDDGIQILASLVNITERKQAEEKIKTALTEKEVMLKEIHHRVKNNLQVISSLLNLQSRYIEDEATLAIFKESRSRVRSMALIHEKLYQTKDFSQVDFSDYARDLSAQLIRANTDSRDLVRLDMDVEGIFLGIDTAVPCGLIINELLTNALQHAFPSGRKGTVKLQLHSKKPAKKQSRDFEKVVLTVSDDGVGLPEGFNIEETTTLGMQLVKTLSEQIDGVLKIKSGKGANFAITFDAKASDNPEVSVIEK